MATKTATANNQILSVSDAFNVYDAGGFTGVTADFSGVSDITLSLHDPAAGTGITSNFAGGVAGTLIHILIVKGAPGDDFISFAAGSASAFVAQGSEGSDTYVLNGHGTLSYAGYGLGLTFDLADGAASVSGKTAGASDTLVSLSATLIGTGHDDTMLLDGTNTIGTVDGAGGTDTLSWESITDGVVVGLDTGHANVGAGTFTGFEIYVGSSGDDLFTASAATGFTVRGSDGSDTYALGGHGTLSYAGYTSGLAFDLADGAASVSGKTAGASDTLVSLAATLVGTSHDDTVLLDGTNTIGTVDGAGGTDTLSWENITDGVVVGLDAGHANVGANTFTNFEIYVGSSGDDLFTASAATGFTARVSEGSDTYALGGHGTLSYAGYGNGLAFDLTNGAATVSGKAGGNTDVLVSLAATLIGTSHDDTVLLDATNTLGTVDGAGGTDTLSWENITGGVVVGLDAGHANVGASTFTGFQVYVGSSGNDSFTASAATGFTIRASAGSDSYSLGGHGTLSYAAYALGLTFSLAAGGATITGKAASASDTLTSLPATLIATSHDDTVRLDATSNPGSVDGGGGTDTLNWANAASGVVANLDTGVADAGISHFTNFETYVGSGHDDSFTASTATGFTILASEGSDTYDLGGHGTLSYAAYSSGLVFDLASAGLGVVIGKSGGNADALTTMAAALIGTVFDDLVLADATVGSFAAGGGVDTLSWENLSSGVTVNLDSHTASAGVLSFSGFEIYKGSSGNDSFTASAATGFTVLASAGNDSYSLGGHGTLSYASLSEALTIDLSIGSVTGKPDDSHDTIIGTAAMFIGGSGSDHLVGPATGTLSLDGGAGFDVLQLAGTRASWTIINNHDGSGTAIKAGVHLSLSNIEELKFSDTTSVFGAYASNDVFGHGRSSTMWQADNGDVWFWDNNGSSADSYVSAGAVSSEWHVIGLGDQDGDGKADVLWHNDVTNAVYYWWMDGAEIKQQGILEHLDYGTWNAIGTADFNADGREDVLWQRASDGQVYEWAMDHGAIVSQGNVGVQIAGYEVVGFGDLNRDGKQDVVWYNQASGNVETWFMNGTSHTTKNIDFSSDIVVKGVGDFNGDGTADLVGLDASGNVWMAMMNQNGTTASVNLIDTVGTFWDIRQVADYNGDGKADILWVSDDLGGGTSVVYVWNMDGQNIASQGAAGTIDAALHWNLHG